MCIGKKDSIKSEWNLIHSVWDVIHNEWNLIHFPVYLLARHVTARCRKVAFRYERYKWHDRQKIINHLFVRHNPTKTNLSCDTTLSCDTNKCQGSRQCDLDRSFLDFPFFVTVVNCDRYVGSPPTKSCSPDSGRGPPFENLPNSKISQRFESIQSTSDLIYLLAII